MADVRLTAINPEDSQVYPVACNDKGELLLDSGGASGDLDVTGNLTVDGTGQFGSSVTSDFGFLAGGNAGTTTEGVKVTFQGAIHASNSSDSIYLWNGYRTGGGDIGAGNPTSSISSNGSATFAGLISNNTSGAAFSFNRQTINGPADTLGVFAAAGVTKHIFKADGSAEFASDVTTSTQFAVVNSDVQKFRVNSSGSFFIGNPANSGNTSSTNKNIFLSADDGSATFAGYVTSKSNDAYFAYMGPGGFYGNSNSSTESFRLDSNAGTATFTGNVTAPNINFKLAPATVAAMPAPLIDEGFAADQTVDLLSVIMEMKLQIRDLNAFMQRSTQDDVET